MSRDFPGSSGNYLRLLNPSGLLDITGTGLTISAWIRPDSVTGFHTVVAKWSGTDVANQYVLQSNGVKLTAAIGNGSNGFELVDNTGPLVTGAWQHVALVKSGTGAGALKSYINAVAASVSSSFSIGDTSMNFTIGARTGGENLFDGLIADVGVWTVGLSAEEIAALAKGASPLRVRPVNLAGYFPLWGVGDAGDPDLSGGAEHLSEVGTVGVADHAPVGPYVAA